jgi:DNA-binding LacI/PurR family transcriptional regulator
MARSESKPKTVTLQTIADRLGVSRTTVSNAYGRPDQLNPALRDKILEVAKDLGYAGPDAAGRMLRRGKADALGVLFTDVLAYAFTDPAAVLLLQGIAEAAGEAEVGLVLLPAPAGRAPEVAPVREAVVDTFIIYSVADEDPRIEAILARGLPTVAVDDPRRPGCAFVGIDDRGGAREAATHLAALGHRRFGVIVDYITAGVRAREVQAGNFAAAACATARYRLTGYEDAITAAGIPWESVAIEERPGNTQESGYAAAMALLDRQEPPTAILAVTDQFALGALRAAKYRGIRVPEELSVVGFDDVPAAATSDPPLTTVRQPLLEKGRMAGKFALEPWPEDEPPEVILPLELIVRGSTGPAPD